ncbi:MAG: peptide deformylase [Christensenellales bacterium]|jgi:peptide deformylase
MASREILKAPHPTLRKISRPVDKITPRILELLDDLIETMYESEGAGLAAPQVGVLRRVVVIDVGDGLLEMINPVIRKCEGKLEEYEGCLSVPGQTYVVERPETVEVELTDRSGERRMLTAEGYLARAICHELDHLDGRLFIDIVDYDNQPEEGDKETEEGS